MDDERRQYSRIAFHSPAELVFPDHTLNVVVLDISLKGALIELPAGAVMENFSVCMLHVHLNAGEINDNISMETRVAHSTNDRAGLLCLTIDIDSVTHLRRLVSSTSAIRVCSSANSACWLPNNSGSIRGTPVPISNRHVPSFCCRWTRLGHNTGNST